MSDDLLSKLGRVARNLNTLEVREAATKAGKKFLKGSASNPFGGGLTVVKEAGQLVIAAHEARKLYTAVKGNPNAPAHRVDQLGDGLAEVGERLTSTARAVGKMARNDAGKRVVQAGVDDLLKIGALLLRKEN